MEVHKNRPASYMFACILKIQQYSINIMFLVIISDVLLSLLLDSAVVLFHCVIDVIGNICFKSMIVLQFQSELLTDV